MTAVESIPTAAFERRQDGALVIRLGGPWQLRGSLPNLALLERELDTLPPSGTVAFDTSELTEWDSGLLTAVTMVFEFCNRRQLGSYTSVRYGLPDGSVCSSLFASSCDMLGRPAVMCRAR